MIRIEQVADFLVIDAEAPREIGGGEVERIESTPQCRLGNQCGRGMDQARSALHLRHRRQIAPRLHVTRKRHWQGVLGIGERFGEIVTLRDRLRHVAERDDESVAVLRKFRD